MAPGLTFSEKKKNVSQKRERKNVSKTFFEDKVQRSVTSLIRETADRIQANEWGFCQPPGFNVLDDKDE